MMAVLTPAVRKNSTCRTQLSRALISLAACQDVPRLAPMRAIEGRSTTTDINAHNAASWNDAYRNTDRGPGGCSDSNNAVLLLRSSQSWSGVITASRCGSEGSTSAAPLIELTVSLMPRIARGPAFGVTPMSIGLETRST